MGCSSGLESLSHADIYSYIKGSFPASTQSPHSPLAPQICSSCTGCGRWRLVEQSCRGALLANMLISVITIH